MNVEYHNSDVSADRMEMMVENLRRGSVISLAEHGFRWTAGGKFTVNGVRVGDVHTHDLVPELELFGNLSEADEREISDRFYSVLDRVIEAQCRDLMAKSAKPDEIDLEKVWVKIKEVAKGVGDAVAGVLGDILGGGKQPELVPVRIPGSGNKHPVPEGE